MARSVIGMGSVWWWARPAAVGGLLAACNLLSGCTGTGAGLSVPPPQLKQVDDRYEVCTDPGFIAAAGRAQAQLDRRDLPGALASLQEAARLGLDHVPTHLAYIETAEALGDAALDGVKSFYTNLPDRPNSPVPPFCRARLAEDDHTRLTLLDDALRRDPSFYFGHLAQARINRAIGRLDVAQQALVKALAARPRHLDSSLEMGAVLMELGKYVQAEPFFAAYVAARPEDRLAAKTYAQLLLYRLNKPREAGVVLRRLAQEAPQDADVAMDIAALAWREGRVDEAIAGYHRVLQLDSSAARAALNLGNLYFELGERAEGEGRRAHWARARKAYQFFLKAPRAVGLHDTLDETFSVPYRLDFLASAVPADDAVPTPGANF